MKGMVKNSISRHQHTRPDPFSKVTSSKFQAEHIESMYVGEKFSDSSWVFFSCSMLHRKEVSTEINLMHNFQKYVFVKSLEIVMF